MGELTNHLSCHFWLLVCQIVLFQSKDHCMSSICYFSLPCCGKGSLEYYCSFPPRATPWLQPVTSGHCIFCVEWSLQIEAVTPCVLLSFSLYSERANPAVLLLSPQENPRHHLNQSSSFRVFILGPYYVWTRFLPAFEHGRRIVSWC